MSSEKCLLHFPQWMIQRDDVVTDILSHTTQSAYMLDSWLNLLIKSVIFPPIVSVNLEYHDGWCALKSPRIRITSVVRRYSIED